MKNSHEMHIYSRDFKLKFMGEGDWLDEPDMLEFDHRDIKCLISRVVMREPCAKEEAYFGGHLCGYIFVPESHPLYGNNFSEIELDCWGGVTWSEITHDGYMIGFDCAHSGDVVPTMQHMRNTIPAIKKISEMFPIPEGYEKLEMFHPTYKNMSFCISEVKSMAAQAAKMMVPQ